MSKLTNIGSRVEIIIWNVLQIPPAHALRGLGARIDEQRATGQQFLQPGALAGTRRSFRPPRTGHGGLPERRLPPGRQVLRPGRRYDPHQLGRRHETHRRDVGAAAQQPRPRLPQAQEVLDGHRVPPKSHYFD